MTFERYAIYWAPPRGSGLAEFGRAWLGSDAEAGAYTLTREHFGLPYALSQRAVASPRRYCLHATMKAPFRLAPGRDESELRAAMAAFASRRRRFAAGPLKLHAYGDYLTLLPETPLADLDWLAAECVVAFDAFRAPLNDADRARRPRDLPAHQAALLGQFGYPYVLSEFRFHVTLAGPLPTAELSEVRDALAPAVAPFCAGPLAIEELCLFGDPGGDGPFRLIERFPLPR
ncbi:MAG: DUF1045 domain-containing protein [Hyphomicrobiales bacterium]|nr:DUF1045 domain-containing protein [Hyphomicrobiales bacterium]